MENLKSKGDISKLKYHTILSSFYLILPNFRNLISLSINSTKRGNLIKLKGLENLKTRVLYIYF